MEDKKVEELYRKLVQEAVSFFNEEKIIYVNDLIKISSTIVCFAVDVLKNNTDISNEEIESILGEALKYSISSDQDLEFSLSDKGVSISNSKDQPETPTTVIKNNKLLN